MENYSAKFLSIFAFLLLSILSSAVALLRPPSIRAEKLIRDLNLFPNKPINVIDLDRENSRYFSSGQNIVQWRVKFPNLVDPRGVSVEDLGHHAGYYQIQRSHAARFVP